MVVLGVTKILHESGHGLSCRHFGGECPEVGVMLLVMTPCLYCNVSDSWMLPSKWKRAMIGAAGMYVELILASIATFVWWYSNPGLLHHLALSTMFVCSVSTVMFNANPLLRYDGYYILSDLVEVPNLSQKASAVLRRLVTEWTLGLESRDDPFMPERGLAWYVAYAVASGVYRWVVTFSILLFLNEFFNPYRLEMLSYLLAIGAVFELIVQPVVSLVRFFRVPRPSDQYKRRRIQLTLAGLAAAAAIVLFLPIPHRVYGTLELEPYKPQNVFVEVPGELAKTLVRPGEHVEPGTILATLESDDLDLQIAELRGKCEQFRTKLASLRHRRFEDLAAGAQLPEVEKTLVAYEQQLAQKERDRDRLTLVAQRAGTVIPPPEQAKKDSPDHELATWTGSPFEPKNIGCHLDESTLLCQVGDPEQFEAIVVLDQADLGHVKVGQCVDLKLDEFPHDTFRSTIEEIARADLKVSPRHLSNKAGGELATKTDAKGVERPLSISYQARIPLRSPAGELRSGLCGRAKIYTPWESAAVRGWRWFSQTFHFRL
jgi:putative peptide zinc metalloprotease protein